MRPAQQQPHSPQKHQSEQDRQYHLLDRPRWTRLDRRDPLAPHQTGRHHVIYLNGGDVPRYRGAGTLYILGKQSEKIEQVRTQTNGNLTRLQAENERLTNILIAHGEYPSSERGLER